MATRQVNTQTDEGKVIVLGTERFFNQDGVMELYGLAMAMKTVGVLLAKNDSDAGDLIGPSYLFGALATRAEDLQLTLESQLDPDATSLLIDTVAALRLIAEHLDSASHSEKSLNEASALVNSFSKKISSLGEELDNRPLCEIQ